MINLRRILIFSSLAFVLVIVIATTRNTYKTDGNDIAAGLQRVSAHGWKPANSFDVYDEDGKPLPVATPGKTNNGLNATESGESKDAVDESQTTEVDDAIDPMENPTEEASAAKDRPKPSGIDTCKNDEDTSCFLDDWYDFQAILEMPQPATNIADFASLAPHNYSPAEATHAFATLITTRTGTVQDPTRDPYFEAALFLAWRFLWSPKTKSARYPFIAFVAPHITEQQRNLLRGMGAVVRELELVPWEPKNGHDIHERWSLMFSKLHLWKQIDFAKIALFDADAFPFTNLDGLFDVVQRRHCKRNQIEEEVDKVFADDGACEYTMAGVNDFDSGAVNGGLLVLEANMAMHSKLLAHYNETSRYDNSLVEQAYLGWQFEQNGSFPAQFIDRTWNGYFPKDEDKGMLKVVHQKIWADFIEEDWMKTYWYDGWNEMVRWIDSDEFMEERQKDQAIFEKASKAH